MSLLIVGTLAFDTVETPFGKEEMIVGGSAQYAAYAASYYFNDINLVSIIGDDFPKDELSELQSRGAKIDGVKLVEGGEVIFLGWKVSRQFKRQRHHCH